MRSRTLLAILALGVFTPGAHAAQLSADDVLKKVEEVYTNLRSYKFSAQSETLEREDLESEHDGRTGNGAGGSVDNEIGGGVTSGVELEASDHGQVRLWVRSMSSANQILVVSDGHRTWASLPLDKKYTEIPVALVGASDTDARAVADELGFVRQYWNLLVGRYRNISKVAAGATLGKDTRIKVHGEKIECYVVKWQTAAAKDEMYVDKDQFIVWHLRQSPKAGPSGSSRAADATLDVSQAELNPHLEDSVFTFTPPEKFTKVAELKWPGSR